MSIAFLDAEHGARDVAARIEGDVVLIEAAEIARLTGWTRRPEGLCRDEACVPVRDPDLDRHGAIDVARMAAALGRPAVVDAAAGVVAWGERSADRRRPIESGVASDFNLPRLAGGDFRFSSIGRHKKLLLAWSSW
jgi:hypothetical protein